ncbi:hypothetical protein A1D29_10065 [Pasteurellaceae bacterium Orientalotternb1]|nr:hypothetical protein A1D29_10065 [Pasteurellaceae bacterium Orientalotternb1]
MPNTSFTEILLGSGALITIITLIINHFFRIYNEDISKERIKWRERIRELSMEIVSFQGSKDDAYKLYSELSNRLNPYDESDKEISEKAYKLLNIEAENSNISKKDFVRDISILLKDDWERCKFDSKLRSIIPFINYKSKRNTENDSQ